jgi:hypothetical protein
VEDEPPDSGRYRRGAEIARGGMGRVVEAEDAVLGRTVALKETLELDPDARARFEREVRITARLEHPSIVPVYDAGRTPAGLPFYIMRRLSGRPLDQIIKAAPSLDERLTFVPNLLAVLDAVGHAHRRGIIHRDLKPANVLIGDLGETVVIDWGLAKVIGEAEIALGQPLPALGDALTDATVAGLVVGTPGFMPPEQAAGQDVDARSDVFALGATLYHLLAGEPAFAGSSATAIIDRSLAAPPAPLADVVPGVPRELAAIVETAMAREPCKRYADAAAMGEDLRRFLSGRLVAAHHYSPRERLVRYIRRHRTILSVVALAVAALAVVGTLSLRRIVADRDRIASARATAEDRRAEAEARSRELRALADGLIVDQARLNLRADPTLSIALLKGLPADSSAWPGARAIVAEARARGIAFALPGHPGIVMNMDIAPDHRHLLTVGANDGTVRVHDLEARTTATIARGITTRDHVFRWAGKQIAHLDLEKHELSLISASTGAVQRVLSSTAAWVDTSALGSVAWPELDGTLKWLRIDTTDPQTIDTVPGIDWIQASPGGEWVVIEAPKTAGKPVTSRLYHRVAGRWELGLAVPSPNGMIVFAYDDARAAYLGHDGAVVELDLTGSTPKETRLDLGPVLELGYAGDRLWTKHSEVGKLTYRDRATTRQTIRNPALALMSSTYGPAASFGHGSLVIAGAVTTGRIALTSPEYQPVELFATDIVERVAAQPGCRWVVGAAGGRILVWDLAEVLARSFPKELTPNILQPFGEHHFLAGDFGQSQVLDTRTDLYTERESVLGSETLVVDPERGIALKHSPDRIEVIAVDGWTKRTVTAAVAHVTVLDPDTLAAAIGDQLVAIDIATGTRRELGRLGAPIALLRSHHGWVFAGAADRLLRTDGTVVEDVRAGGRVITADVLPDGTVVLYTGDAIERWPRHASATSVVMRPSIRIEILDAYAADSMIALAEDHSAWRLDLATATIGQIMPTLSTIPKLDNQGRCAVAVRNGAIIVADLAGRAWWTLPTNEVSIAAPGPTCEQIFGASLHNELLTWDVLVPYGSTELHDWIDARTNARASKSHGVIEWDLPSG